MASESHNRINEAVSQNFNADKLATYYDGWAEQYDADVTSQAYQAPHIACTLLAKHTSPSHDTLVLDVGCGTGLAGPVLKSIGFQSVHGFDLSQEMVAKAQQTGAYASGGLWGGIDMTVPYELGGQKYGAAISVGVFTSGHVKPQSMEHLLPHLNQGAIVVLTAREVYAKEEGLDQYLEELHNRNLLKTLEVQLSQPYHDLSKAHYYVLQVL